MSEKYGNVRTNATASAVNGQKPPEEPYEYQGRGGGMAVSGYYLWEGQGGYTYGYDPLTGNIRIMDGPHGGGTVVTPQSNPKAYEAIRRDVPAIYLREAPHSAERASDMATLQSFTPATLTTSGGTADADVVLRNIYRMQQMGMTNTEPYNYAIQNWGNLSPSLRAYWVEQSDKVVRDGSGNPSPHAVPATAGYPLTNANRPDAPLVSPGSVYSDPVVNEWLKAGNPK